MLKLPTRGHLFFSQARILEALYGFPGAADTKYHKTCGLKPQECFVSQSWG